MVSVLKLPLSSFGKKVFKNRNGKCLLKYIQSLAVSSYRTANRMREMLSRKEMFTLK